MTKGYFIVHTRENGSWKIQAESAIVSGDFYCFYDTIEVAPKTVTRPRLFGSPDVAVIPQTAKQYVEYVRLDDIHRIEIRQASGIEASGGNEVPSRSDESPTAESGDAQ